MILLAYAMNTNNAPLQVVSMWYIVIYPTILVGAQFNGRKTCSLQGSGLGNFH